MQKYPQLRAFDLTARNHPFALVCIIRLLYFLYMHQKRSIIETTNSPLRRVSLYLSLIWLFVFISALAITTYVFISFFDGSQSWISLLQLFCLCFGVSTVVYIPALVIFCLARRVYTNGPTKSIGAGALALALPWIIASIVVVFYRLPHPLVFITMGVLGFGVAIWAILIIFHSLNTKIPPQNQSDDSEPV
ncbi:MAG: hypothetical protein COA43_07675 [Robiginitomaculum sp.]|nr:MAG: hypothetical protein COA43_07675 [Robiginitomaculum sp.]